MIFAYGEKETAYLTSRDSALGNVINKIGKIERAVDTDLFSALCYSIVSQQISAKAYQTVRRRIEAALVIEPFKALTPEALLACPVETLQAFGMTFRKARYLHAAATRIVSGAFDLQSLHTMEDTAIVKALTAFDGVGTWTAEMLMIFSMQRPDVLSFGDLAIHRGLRMLYNHEVITRPLFDTYRQRYSPYASVASLYLWAIAGGI